MHVATYTASHTLHMHINYSFNFDRKSKQTVVSSAKYHLFAVKVIIILYAWLRDCCRYKFSKSASNYSYVRMYLLQVHSLKIITVN